MQVILLSTKDLQAYRALMLHAYSAAADAFTSTPEERIAESDSWWANRLSDPKGLSLTFGAFQGAHLMGAVSIEFSTRTKTQHKAHLIGMFVAEAARLQGVGKQLLQAALTAAQSRPGVQIVQLTVTQGNEAAVALYQSWGFKSYGIEPMAIATPDGFKSKVHMWLALADLPSNQPLSQ